MPKIHRKRSVVSFENMSEELAAVFNEKYPKGYSDYLQDLDQFEKPDGTTFFAVPIEIEDAIYLVKIKVKTDAAEDIERWLEGDEDDSGESGGEGNTGDTGGSLPDDNISQYGSSEGEDDS